MALDFIGPFHQSSKGRTYVLTVTVTFQQLPQVLWGFYQPLNWAWLAWVRRKTHSVVWGLMEQRGTTDDNFKQLYSHISQITYHITVTWTSIQLHYTRLMTSFDDLMIQDFIWFDSVERRKNTNTLIINNPYVLLFSFQNHHMGLLTCINHIRYRSAIIACQKIISYQKNIIVHMAIWSNMEWQLIPYTW